MAYLVDRNGKTLGPFLREEIPQRVAAQEIALSDLACNEYHGRWMPLSELLASESSAPKTIPNTLAHKRSFVSIVGWGGILGIAYFFYRIARLMHAFVRAQHPH